MATESINTDILSDETFKLLCSVCKRKGKNCKAEKFCVECNDYYCLACVKVHEDVAILSGHKILDKGQFETSKGLSASQQGSGQTLPAAPTERCNIHNIFYIDMYCQTHDDVGCATCIAEDHRLCKDTIYIQKFLQNNANITTSKDVAQILEEVTKMLTKSHSDLQHEKQKLLKAKADTLENIRKFRKEINDRLDKLEKNSINEIENLYQPLIEEREKAIKEVQANQSNIKSAQNELAAPGNNVSQVFVNAKKGNKTAKMASKWIEENKTRIAEVNIDFEADQRLSKCLKEINALGNAIQRNMKGERNMASSAIGPQDKKAITSQSIKQKKYPVTSSTFKERNVSLQGLRQKNFTVKEKSDKSECNIVSACALEDGTIILSDKNNMKLKHLDSSTYTVTDYCELPCQPWQVCPIGKQEIAVCLPEKQVVQFLAVGSRMSKTREIKTDFDCYSLAYANDNLYISESEKSVYIYNVAGRKLKKFCLDKSGQRLFSNIHSLAVSKDGSRIYVTDCYKGLIVLDKNGQVVERFNDPELKFANGCYLTKKGSLLVCGEYSHNVLYFGPDGELIEEVVKSYKKKYYQTVCCNQQMSKLIIGSDSNEIEVYDLEQGNNK